MSAQDLILAIVPKIGASISIPCSLFIISESIGDHRRGRGTAIQRALVGMSCVDVSASFAWWLSNWATPKDTGGLARGNFSSCQFQGFLLQLAVGAPLYNCSLSLYYLLVIRYNWTNEQLAKIERFVHAFILTFAIGTSIAGLPLTMYNRVDTVCWVVGKPADCGHSIATSINNDVPCERGDYAWIFGVFLFYLPLWVCVLLTIVAMSLIYRHVRETFGKLRVYGFEDNSSDGWFLRLRRPGRGGIISLIGGSGNENQSAENRGRPDSSSGDMNSDGGEQQQQTRRDQRKTLGAIREHRRATKLAVFATQASLYSASFFITWSPSTVWSVASWFNVTSFWLSLAAALCEPLQGLWNLMVFLRRREASREKIRNALGSMSCVLLVLKPVNQSFTSFTSSFHKNSSASNIDGGGGGGLGRSSSNILFRGSGSQSNLPEASSSSRLYEMSGSLHPPSRSTAISQGGAGGETETGGEGAEGSGDDGQQRRLQHQNNSSSMPDLSETSNNADI